MRTKKTSTFKPPEFNGNQIAADNVHDTLGQHLPKSRAFSASSCRSRLTSTASTSPKRLRQA
jgi:hypothetical protein